MPALITPKHPDIRSRKWDFYVNHLAASSLLRDRDRVRIYRALGMELHSDRVRPGCFFQSDRFRLGRDASVNLGCFIENVARVEVGDATAIGFHVRIITSSHLPGEPPQTWGQWVPAPVRIGDRCWIGVGATILPGVTIGDSCIIAAGAVVTGDCDPFGLYAGVPARRVRDLPEGAAAEAARASGNGDQAAGSGERRTRR